MYGPLRDLFREVLGHGAGAVLNEPTTEGGRPDLVVSVPHPGAPPGHRTLATIVVEAKDERGTVTSTHERNRVFAAKAKYVGFDTRWFVVVDPEAIVARPVQSGVIGRDEIMFRWDSAGGLQEFQAAFAPLSADQAGFADLLGRFRTGDQALIASIKLNLDDADDPNRRRFFTALTDAAATLQSATRSALEGQLPRLAAMRQEFAGLSSKYPHVRIESVDPIRITARPQGPVEARAFAKDRVHIERLLNRHRRLARLEFEELPQLAQRIGADLDNQADRDRLLGVFAAETANLILARVLLIRFFEDHAFFGPRKYVCNGGVEAVRHMMLYFARTYTLLLRNAYYEAGEFYEAAFAETAFDWVFEDQSEVLSRALEWVLFSMSLFDFTTVRGDVLSGIYERFMDPEHRKRFGEYYTPPSIARWMLRQLDLVPGDEVLDPACGSGTFLIEAYELLAGEPQRRGFGTWEQARVTAEALAGNDLNRFAAVLTQIQLLWHLLPMRDRILADGFPDLQVVEGANALTVGDLLSSLDRFTEIATPRYKAVVGNPPYVRTERQTLALDRDSAGYYEDAIGARNNLYALFLYRALQDWCRVGTEGLSPGRVAFIIPHSMTDARETARLRSLFAPGGPWRIREIVDLESIGPLVFDAADVVAIVLIAERHPADAEDRVRVRVADASSVREGTAGGRLQFDLDAARAADISYHQLFSSDGRIRTRLTQERAEILEILGAAGRLEQAALTYYVQRAKGRLVAASLDPTVLTHRTERWEQRTMLTGGLAFRRTYRVVRGGTDVYKGENVVSLGLVGDAPFPGADLTGLSDPSVWRFTEILPSVAYAIAGIEQLPNAVRFDPRVQAFTNTVTLFAPRKELASFPFDLLLHSRIYRYAYALGFRMGVLFRRRSHMYPENIRQLPWNAELMEVGAALEDLRQPLLDAYHLLHARTETVQRRVDALGFSSLVQVARGRPGASLHWGELFIDPEYGALVGNVNVQAEGDRVRVEFGTAQQDNLEVEQDPELAEWVSLALVALRGRLLNRDAILAMRVPASAQQADALLHMLVELNDRDASAERDAVLDQMDQLIGGALGLSPVQISEIQRDLREDPFLRSLGVREPYTSTRLLGPRENLDRSDRYR